MSKIYSLGLLGYPVSHLLSPRLHQAALVVAGLEGSIGCIRLRLARGRELWELKELLGRVRGGNIFRD